ncbi:DegT/DnrJ/EryC1/StrS family aminotransferase [Bacillus sp. FJAT-29790]|uniref:DegT/DnrJ/EryC1/StrS family aminotransferase n=1 Tax=Bacillus sp. FJAT-29790 TaxID=1895002 RepID=UPI001C2172E3|nr:DegT/DnrJ/EryC1/StrS family aminotransferase [Bacillus sp. FJAT-29790]MBU8880786.1 DegT/DnrJ/EryC1/StrS family aminotransferase [Bacillus sp. FJAT-29790]
MKIPMLDLTVQYEQIKRELNEKIQSVLNASHFILGENVRRLEEDIAAYSNVRYGIGVANGSDALHISLTAIGIGPGDEVITTPFTFFATAGAISRAGAIPVFADIEPHTFNINSNLIEQKITSKTKAIIAVHLYGQPADMDSILKVADKYGLFVIEDAAQAIGAKYKGRKVGGLGDAACFSFFPTKNLGAYGDGGMIVTNNENQAEKMKLIRVHGAKERYNHQILGYNSRLDEIQAAILNVKFLYLDSWNNLRREKAHLYTNLLSKVCPDKVVLPIESEGNHHIYHQYTIKAERRNELKAYLSEHGIDTIVYYPIPLHLQPVFADLGYKKGDFPLAEKAAIEVLSLPIFPELTEGQQIFIVEKISDFYERRI